MCSVLLTTLFSCQKDDGLNSNTATPIEASSSTITTVSADDIPDIMGYVNNLPQNRDGKFSIFKDSGDTRSSEPDLVLGALQTNEVIQSTNAYSRRNHTFLLNTLQTTSNDSTSIFNLIVKETSSGIYSYIIENRMATQWYRNQRLNIRNGYSGLNIFYSSEGIYAGKTTFHNGTLTDLQERNPCDVESNNPTGGTTGDTGNPGDTGDTGDTGTTGDTTGNQSGGIEIYEDCQECTHPEHLPHNSPCQHPLCVVVIEIRSSQIERKSRNPCNNTECASENDCVYGWNDDCSCKEEPSEDPEEDENPDVATLIPPINDCESLNNLTNSTTNIKTRFNQLKNHEGDFEKGFTIDVTLNSDDFTASNMQGDQEKYKLNILRTPLSFAMTHSHPNSDDFLFFSGEDILSIAALANSYSGPNFYNFGTFTVFLVTDDRTFALRFEDNDSMSTIIDISSNKRSRKNFIKRLLKNYAKDINLTTGENTNISKQQRRLFDLLDELNLNLSFYEATYEDGFINNWEEINTETLAKEPCN